MDRSIIDMADFILNETFKNQSYRNLPPRDGSILLNGWSDDEAFYVEAQLPGFSSETIDLCLTGKELSIKATVENDESDEIEEQDYIIRERPFGSWERTLTFGDDINEAKIEATCTNGLLKIRLPKAESAKPRQIAITTN